MRFVHTRILKKPIKRRNKVWGEHELDHVFTGIYEGPVKPDPNESSGYEWIRITDLKKDVKANPQKYSPWFMIILRKLGI
jgi:isopentenyl-diphosphate delta-isomerase